MILFKFHWVVNLQVDLDCDFEVRNRLADYSIEKLAGWSPVIVVNKRTHVTFFQLTLSDY